MKFENLPLHKDILRGIRDTGFTRCTPVQEQTLLESISGRDIMAQAQTGTGKTAAFLITVFHRLLITSPPETKPHALILVPTRELAVQVENDAKDLGRHLDISIINVIGGVAYEKQIEALRSGTDIVVGTPGRLIDLLKNSHMTLSGINFFVIDEADRMFDMGFIPDVRYIARKIPPIDRRQTMLFSATLDTRVRRMAEEYMHNPEDIEIEPEQITVESINQVLYHVGMNEKLPLLLGLLESGDISRSIIFANTKAEAERLGFKLCGNGHTAEVLTGDVSQKKRFRIIDRMKRGKLPILVATDVAARGLHIEDVSHVINYDLPNDAASYVHRIGRTARAGKTGHAVCFACEKFVFNLESIEALLEHEIEQIQVEDGMLVKDVAGRFYPTRRTGGAKTTERDKRREKSGGQRVRRNTRSFSNLKQYSDADRHADTDRPKKKVKNTTGKNVRSQSKHSSRPNRKQSLQERKKQYMEKYGITPK
jgi:ATP-dependent RNA helicase RhlB